MPDWAEGVRGQLLLAAGMMLALAVAAGVAEHRRRRRRDMDRVGLVPWVTIQMAALLVAFVLASAAFHV